MTYIKVNSTDRLHKLQMDAVGCITVIVIITKLSDTLSTCIKYHGKIHGVLLQEGYNS